MGEVLGMGETRIPVIETDRLILRGPTEGDAEAWAAFLGDPDDFRYMPWKISGETTTQRATRIVDGLRQGWETQPPSSMGWVCTLKSDGHLIGLGGVDQVEDANEGEIGYRFGKPFWGQGYAIEAARAMTHFAFENTQWARIVAYVVRENTPSVRLLERLGMTHEQDVDYRELMGNPTDIQITSWDAALYAIARDDFSPGDAPYSVRGRTADRT
jgi:RimJ/RimL family protein N-acetyltransferase